MIHIGPGEQFHPDCGSVENLFSSAKVGAIDGDLIRNALHEDRSVSDWMMGDVIQEALPGEIASKFKIFVE